MTTTFRPRDDRGAAPKAPDDDPQWMPDPKVEALLARLDVAWEWATVPLVLIDAQASRRNQARLSDILAPGTVEEYAEAMRRGDRFPALVAHATGAGTFVLNGGNHRAEAARIAGRQSVAVYLIRTNDVGMRHLLTVLLNTVEGARPSRADLMSQCLYMIDHFGYGQAETAAQFGLPLSAVQNEKRRGLVRKRLAAAGVDPDVVSFKVMDRLFGLTGDVAFKEVTSLVVTAKLTEAEARDLIRDVRMQRTEDGIREVSARWRARDDIKLRRAGLTTQKASQAAAVKRTVLGALRGVLTMVQAKDSRAAMGLTNDDDYTAAINLCVEIYERLEHVRASNS